MSKKKKKHPQMPVPKLSVRLSQCMIVKNEEKNIERALAWAKPVAYEQIVVDTGSTDKTVEIAEKLGAKVYHFEWIKDFSAAKNYAIEQASGNWIAFLDADEYFSPEDTSKLIIILENIEKDSKLCKSVMILNTPWVQLDDSGEATSIDEQGRIFRNIKEIRYVGKIHEKLSVTDDILLIDDISIMHTGYAETEYREKDKAARNVEMLRDELAEKSDDIILKAYLADSLNSKIMLADIPNKKEIAEADRLYKEVLDSKEDVPGLLKQKAYEYFMEKIWDDPDKLNKCKELCEKAHKELPANIDFIYYYATILNKMGEYKKAWDFLKDKDPMLAGASRMSEGTSAKIASDPTAFYGQMLLAAQGLGDIDNVFKYAGVMLSYNKTDMGILVPYILKLLKKVKSLEEALGYLGKIYDITSPGDLLIIARAAKDGGAVEFAKIIMDIANKQM